jgi:hypothetical protein
MLMSCREKPNFIDEITSVAVAAMVSSWSYSFISGNGRS